MRGCVMIVPLVLRPVSHINRINTCSTSAAGINVSYVGTSSKAGIMPHSVPVLSVAPMQG